VCDAALWFTASATRNLRPFVQAGKPLEWTDRDSLRRIPKGQLPRPAEQRILPLKARARTSDYVARGSAERRMLLLKTDIGGGSQNERPLCLTAFSSTLTQPAGTRFRMTRIHHSVFGCVTTRKL
jgi:hypothetical protein